MIITLKGRVFNMLVNTNNDSGLDIWSESISKSEKSSEIYCNDSELLDPIPKNPNTGFDQDLNFNYLNNYCVVSATNDSQYENLNESLQQKKIKLIEGKINEFQQGTQKVNEFKLTFNEKQFFSSSLNPNYQLQAKPDWFKIYDKYREIRNQWKKNIIYKDSEYTKIIEKNIMDNLKKYSQCPAEDKLDYYNEGLDKKSIMQRWENCFGNSKAFDSFEILIFNDGSQKINRPILQKDINTEIIFVDILHIDNTYNGYQKGLREYQIASKGFGTPGDKELYFSKVKERMGHRGVAYVSQKSGEYDLFETSNTVIAKHRISLAMKESYQVLESDTSAAQSNVDNKNDMIELQGDIALSIIKSKSCNLCCQYSLAYVLARQICNDNELILNLFQKELVSNSKQFISIIAGIGLS
jgi:hypothetical protein